MVLDSIEQYSNTEMSAASESCASLESLAYPQEFCTKPVIVSEEQQEQMMFYQLMKILPRDFLPANADPIDVLMSASRYIRALQDMQAQLSSSCSA
ncbi:Oidioi.mRNA.OKI2018_I69.XSR.g16319.t1.cds [Oikopleura dioica]|uniref:Oidioi.mRNA.OKI2018_I69.XSR.g16319.t1.cds n=1 Tax=Oikopleura dioica TaxID=34765 RepID=A0ABN7SFP9_OIKDI|nr:Oidioi.mRNA.OKI2018_I69.XSR.g16319.t1.cds [Oikopleura dioica]